MDQQQLPQIQDDEIDLFELFGQLWDAKWLIIAVTLITGGMGAVYAKFLQQKPYVATLEIRKLQPSTLIQYQQFNTVLGDGGILPEVPKVSGDYLKSLFSVALTDKSRTIGLLESSPFVSRRANQSEAEFQLALRKNANDFVQIERPDLAKDPLAANLIVKLQLPNGKAKEEDVFDLVNGMVADAESYAHDTFGQRFSAAVRTKIFQQTNIKEDLLIERGLLKENYDEVIDNRLAFLLGQANIARATGVKKSAIKSFEGGQDATVVTNIEGNAPYYLRGYEAIEAEINEIKARPSWELFVPRVAEIDAEIRLIDAKKDLERVNSLFNETDLAANQKDQFKAVTTNIDALVVERSSKSMLILALSLVIGGMLAVLYVLIRNAVRNRKARMVEA